MPYSKRGTIGLYSVDFIPILETPDKYRNFERRVREWIGLSGLGEVNRPVDKPPEPPDGLDALTDIEERRYIKARDNYEAFVDHQAQAVAVIKSRLGRNLWRQVENLTTVKEVLDYLKKLYDEGAYHLQYRLIYEFQSITLNRFKDVSSYAERFREIDEELRYLNSPIAPAHVIVRFLLGLSPDYAPLHTTLGVTRTLPIGNETSNAITFEEVVSSTLEWERKLKRDESLHHGSGRGIPAAKKNLSRRERIRASKRKRRAD